MLCSILPCSKATVALLPSAWVQRCWPKSKPTAITTMALMRCTAFCHTGLHKIKAASAALTTAVAQVTNAMPLTGA